MRLKNLNLLLGLLTVASTCHALPTVNYASSVSVSSIGPDAVKCVGPSPADPCVGARQTLSYDTNGNVQTRNDAVDSTNFAYNHDNKLLRATKGNQTVEYVYGPDGEKVATIENGDTTFFFDNGLEAGAHGDSQSYGFSGERIAIKDNTFPSPRYLINDHLGSVRAIADSNGNILSRNDFYPFGETMTQTGNTSADSSYEFSGNRKDVLGIVDYNARSMMPEIGRFMQADTVIPDEKNPQSLNRYTYVENNPLRFVDPTGHSAADALILYSDYGSATLPLQPSYDHTRVDRKKAISEGWESHNSAYALASAWKANNHNSSATVMPIQSVRNLNEIMESEVAQGHSYGFVAIIGHNGRNDGPMFPIGNDAIYNLNSPPDSLASSAGYLRDLNILDGANKFDGDSTFVFQWQWNKAFVTKIINGKPVAGDEFDAAVGFGQYAVRTPYETMKQLVAEGGTMCFVGCQSDGIAATVADSVNVQTLGFRNRTPLMKVGVPSVAQWIKSGKTPANMSTF